MNKPLVSKRSGGEHVPSTWECAIIDVSRGLVVEIHRGEYGHDREHGGGEGYESPFDRLPSAMDGAKQRRHTLEEQHDDYP